jgi:peroxiredoxin
MFSADAFGVKCAFPPKNGLVPSLTLFEGPSIMSHVAKSSLVLAAMTVILVAHGYAGELKIGAAGPDFKGVIGVDDQKHALADYKDAKLLVVVFTCNHCPVAMAYEDRLVALQKDYKAKGVQLVAVNVNNIPEDRLDKMKDRAKQKNFSFPYLYDATQKMGHDYGATKTPHVFLLDKDRKVAYMGAVDDEMAADKVKTPHLRNALDALLAGKKAPKEVTEHLGCSIKYE